MKKIVVCLLLLFAAISTLDAGQYRSMKQLTPIDDANLDLPKVKGKAPRARSMFVLPPGTVLDSSYYDAQRNGSLNRRIWVNEDGSIHATYMKSPDDAFVERGMMYYYADQFGTPFTPSINVATFRNGYGNVASYPTSAPSGAIAIISTHDSAIVGSFAFFDAYQGLGAFSGLTTNDADQVIWPKPSVNSDGSITLLGTLMNDLQVNGIAHNAAWERAADIVTGFTQQWTFFGQDESRWTDANIEWPALAAGDNGRVGIAIPDWGADVHFYESTDNGISFAETMITNAAEDTIGMPTGPDSSWTFFTPWLNVDIVYVGEEPHIVWTGLQPAWDPTQGLVLYDLRSRILHWSPSTGIDTVAIARYNGTWLNDTTYVNPGVRHASIDWPQIGASPDGNILYIVYEAFTPHDVDPDNDIGFGDIWGTFSIDNGETWADPVNISNPDGMYPGADDRYPSISPVNYSAVIDPGKDAYITYQSDDAGGSWLETVFGSGEEETVGNWDYFLFLGVDFDVPSKIEDGGKETGSLVKVFDLHQNYPNPFNPSTTVSFEVPDDAGLVDLSIYDSRGRLVRTLVSKILEPGVHKLTWDGTNDRGLKAASGIYFLRMRCEAVSRTIKMVMMK
ncbi:MAG: FlgD immunoglobulin-like domain containing protein [Candidatus Glassbacteria bacterium]